MLTIIYSPNGGEAVADGAVDRWVETICMFKGDRRLVFSTSNIFLALKLAIQREKIDYNDIRFWYNGQHITLLPDGSHTPHIDGFIDYDLRMIERWLSDHIAVKK